MSTPVIALDIDGTMLDYDYGETPKVNAALLAGLRTTHGKQAVYALVSNQGGLPFGIQAIRRPDGKTYPTPLACSRRLYALSTAFRRKGLTIAHVRYCVFHPRADRTSVQTAAKELRFHVGRHADHFGYSWHVYTTHKARKPEPLMLLSVGATEYYGDSEEDRQAAEAANVLFHRISRFR